MKNGWGCMIHTSLGCATPGPQSTVQRDADEKVVVPESRSALWVCALLSGFESCRQRRAVRGRVSEAPWGRAGAVWRLCRATTRPSTGARACVCILIDITRSLNRAALKACAAVKMRKRPSHPLSLGLLSSTGVDIY